MEPSLCYYIYCSSSDGMWVVTDDKNDIRSNLGAIQTKKRRDGVLPQYPCEPGQRFVAFDSEQQRWMIGLAITATPVDTTQCAQEILCNLKSCMKPNPQGPVCKVCQVARWCSEECRQKDSLHSRRPSMSPATVHPDA